MAKLRANGTELLRIAKERNRENDELVTWERVTRVYCSNGRILQKVDVRFKPDQYNRNGEFYSYGWKVWAKMKKGHDVRDLVAKTKEIIANGKSKWVVENGGPAPVIIPQKRILAALERDEMLGFCRECGAEQSPIEPDARNVRCETCNAMAVYGAEELLIGEVA